MEEQYQQQALPPEQPTVPPQNVNPVPPPQPQQYSYGKRNWLRWILIYLIIAVLIYGGIYYLATQQKKPSPYSTNYPSPTISQPSPTPDPTASWKTYTTPYFLIKYPQDWNLEDIKNSEFKIFTSVVSAITLSKIAQKVAQKEDVSLRLNILVRRYQDKPGFSVQSFENEKTITIDGVPAVQSSGELAGGEASGFASEVHVKKDSLEYFLNYDIQGTSSYIGTNYYDPNFDEFKQILSTFKFTQ